MATRNIDGSNVDRYEGRVSGRFDVDPETNNVRYGEVIMAVVVLDVAGLNLAPRRGEDVGVYVFKVKDFAVVDDDVMRKQLYHHLPHLQPHDDLPQPSFVFPAIESTATSSEDEVYVELPDTHMALEDISGDDLLAHDAEDGEVFAPGTESIERARLRLTSAATDPILQRFLSGD